MQPSTAIPIKTRKAHIHMLQIPRSAQDDRQEAIRRVWKSS